MSHAVDFIDSDDIEAMREDMVALMTQTCTINRPGATRTKGDYAMSNTQIATGVACRLMPSFRTGRERGDDDQRSERNVYDTEHILTVPYDTNLQRGDHIAVTGEASKYIVISLRLEDAQWKTCLRAQVKVIEG